MCGVELDWLAPENLTPEAPQAVVSRKRVLAVARAAVDKPPVNPGIATALREWRRNLAKELVVPAYVILHDSTLDDIAARAPRSIGALCEISGIGEKKAERFGADILGVIAAVNSPG